MSEWKDRRKNIYTVIIARTDGGDFGNGIVEVETFSNKRLAEERQARLVELWVTRDIGTPHEGSYTVTLHATKLQRQYRIKHITDDSFSLK